MHEAHAFLQALAVVLCVAAVTTVLFQRLRQPVVLGYIIAGLIVGPHVPVPLVADMGIVQTLSELGVILLMFSLGLEFSLRKLLSVGPTAGITGLLQCSLLLWLGYAIGRGFGWTEQESIFTGAIIAISSTTIIAKAFDEQQIYGRLRELVVGILIVEDLVAILMMASLTALASGTDLTPAALGMTLGRLAAFLVGLVVIGLFLIPRTMRYIVRLERDETTLVASVGICFAIAFLALEAGYSVALGAFLAGSLIAESGEAHAVERLVQPVRDIFAAIFFVSVGMLIDPILLAHYWMPVAALTAAVVVGKITSVSLGAFLTGNGVRTSVQSGMSLAQIGEFSFIIAALGISLGATGDFLYPIAVAVSALTTLTTPWLIRVSGPFASLVDRKLPKQMQTFVSLYGSWWDRLRSGPEETGSRFRVRRMVRLLLIDTVLVGVIVIGASIAIPRVTPAISTGLGIGEIVVRWLLAVMAFLLSAPFVLGIVRLSRSLGVTLADRAFPPASEAGRLDLSVPARTTLIISLQALILIAVALPVAAITQPLLLWWESTAVFAILLVVLIVPLWRSTTNLHEHVKAGAEMVLEVLSRQSTAASEDHALDGVKALLPELGEPEAIRIPAGSHSAGKSLAELDLRGVTGATILAISRDGKGIAAPTASEVVREGDILAVVGTHDAVELARAILCRTEA